jgi:hypothetical protein
MIVLIKDNFLSKDVCLSLINYFENSKEKNKNGTTTFIDLNVSKNFKEIKLKNKHNTISNLINNSVIDWIQIVKWEKNSFQNLHFDKTKEETTLSSICYLNDDYEGGQTYFENDIIFKPKQGRVIFFDGNYYHHGVKKIEKGTRYTLAAWYMNI